MECLFLNRVFVLDTETTGLEDDDEILQFSIIDGTGQIISNNYYKPYKKTSWIEAEKINHITPEMVVGMPSFQNCINYILEDLYAPQAIVGYNLPFDLRMMGNNKEYLRWPAGIKFIDCMAPMKKRIISNWVSLKTAAQHFNYVPQGNLHDSLEDCRATLHVFKALCREGNLPYMLC